MKAKNSLGSDRELDSIIEGIPGMLVVNNPEGELEYVSRRVLRFVGKEFAELTAFEWANVIHPDDREAVMNEWLRCLKTGEPMEVTYRLRRYDGLYRWFETRVQPAYDDGGQILHWYGLLLDVDDRKKAEEALRRSELQFRVLADATPAMLVTTSPSGEVEYVNQRLQRLHGRTLESLKELGWMSMIHPDDASALYDRWQKAVMDKEPFEVEYRQLCANGTYRWLQCQLQPFRDNAGNVQRWYGVLSDIDDRKTAEEALRDRERQLRQLVETIPALVWRATAEGEVDFVNKGVIDYTGRPEKDVAKSEWVFRIHPDDVDNTVRTWRHNCEEGISHDVTYRLQRADGEYRWFQVRGEPLRDQHGRIISWYGLLLDIHDRKRAEVALSESEHHLRVLVETIPAIVWRTSPQGKLEYVNQRGSAYSGGSWKQLWESRFETLIHPEDAGASLEKWLHSLSTGEPYETIHRLRRADGVYRWFHVLGEPLRDPEGRITHWYGLVIDIDDSRKLAEELGLTRSRLARATQLATVAELSASIAHEVNQPLAAVVANGEACQSWLSKTPPNLQRARLTAERVVRDGKSAADVVSRIRGLFRQSAPVKDLLDLNDVIREALELMAGDIATRTIAVRAELDRSLPQVFADRVQIQQILINLLTNAMDAMDGVEGSPKELTLISSRPEQNAILIQVRDRGSGLSDPESIFDAFFTTKANGMGMGLAICRSIVESHGGQLWATPNTKIGTIFSFTLPVNGEATQ